MKALSILEIPDYKKKDFVKSLLWIQVDYKRFNIKSRKILDSLLMNSIRANDNDNANIAYDKEVAFIRIPCPRWIAHKIVFNVENIWPVPFAYIEVYWLGQWLQWSVAKIDFYGAFFHFFEFIPSRYMNLYDYLMEESKKQHYVRVTRIDIAMDFKMPFPQNFHNWIKPSENSKRDVDIYKHKWKFNSAWYLSNKNSWYWVRWYNKVIDINKQWKHNWYWWEKNIPNHWTRIEFEFYPPYSLKTDDELKKDVWEKLFWSGLINLWLQFRPCFEFKIENAYRYFTRYAEQHWIDFETLIDELISYHMKLEEINKCLTDDFQKI